MGRGNPLSLESLRQKRDLLRSEQVKDRRKRGELRARLRDLAGDLSTRAKRLTRITRRIERKVQKQAEHRGETSDKGLDFVADHEGLVLHAYNDPAGHCTVGVGHLLHHGACTNQDRDSWRDVTRKEAFDLLRSDLDVAEKAVRDLVKRKLTQVQFDALVSLVFNIGSGNFASSTLLRRLNAGDYGSVPGEMLRWVYAGGKRMPGLVARRGAEGRLFARGAY